MAESATFPLLNANDDPTPGEPGVSLWGKGRCIVPPSFAKPAAGSGRSFAAPIVNATVAFGRTTGYLLLNLLPSIAILAPLIEHCRQAITLN
jgi:hypothetical protein